MKKALIIVSLFLFALSAVCQEESDDKATNKKKKNIGEKFSNLAGKLLTAKSDNLSNVALSTNIISGIFDMRTEATETKYYPEGTTEGDYVVSVSFLKQQGAGMIELKGTVLCDGEPMESVGLGSYAKVFKEPFTTPKTVTIKAENGDQAEFILKPVPEIEIISINNDKTLPIVDLGEDITVEFTNPPGSENTIVNAGMLTTIMGTRAFNYFADFPAKKTVITIPKQALSNLTVSGQMNAGQISKGENFFVLERLIKTENSNLGTDQKRGNIPSVVMFSRAYASKPIIVKGKQENGIITELNFAGKFTDERIGFNIHKPNAQNGIPFSRGSNFGLGSLVINGNLYHKDVKSSSQSWDIGNTRYTRTTTLTTVLQFPELPDSHWDFVLDDFYKKLTALFQQRFNITYTDVAKVTATQPYASLFAVDEANNYTKITRTYKNTKRTSPRRLREIFAAVTSSQSSETPLNSLMREADIDGLVSVELNMSVAGDKDNNVVLIPSLNFSIKGRDETKNNRNGTYAEGTVQFRTGVPFNGDAVRANPANLVKACNIDQLIACLDYMLTNLRTKEVDMGYDAIWNMGQ